MKNYGINGTGFYEPKKSEFNVPFQRKYGYITDKRLSGELSPPSKGRPAIY